MAEQKSDTLQAPYVSYATFKGLLDKLRESGQAPNRFDASFWPNSYSGATQSHLKTALYFFGFIDENDYTQDVLRELVSNAEAEQKEKFQEMFLNKYKQYLSGIDLESSTYGELRERFNGTEQMKRKRLAFFIKAAQDCGINLSSYITEGKRQPRKSTNRKSTKKNGKSETPPSEENKNLHTPTELLRVTTKGELFTNWSFDTLESLGVDRVQTLIFALESQMTFLQKWLALTEERSTKK